MQITQFNIFCRIYSHGKEEPIRMNNYKSCSELKGDARDTLSGRYGSYILMLILLFTITFAFQAVIGMFTAVPDVMLIVSGNTNSSFLLTFEIIQLLLSSCVTILIGTARPGLYLFCLNAYCGRQSSVSDLFYAFKGNFKKSLALSAAVVGNQVLCFLPYNLLTLFYQLDKSFERLVLCIALLIIGICIYIPIEIMLSQAFFLMLDFPQYSASELLRMSIKITKGHRGRLFYMELSFIPVFVLALMSFGIGLLWAIPYVNMTYAGFYLDLMKPSPYNQ
jgi:uncharacterized membrane protein